MNREIVVELQSNSEYYKDLQRIAQEQDCAEFCSMVAKYSSILCRLPKINEEINALCVPTLNVDFLQLALDTEPKLKASARLVQSLDRLFLQFKFKVPDVPDVPGFILRAFGNPLSKKEARQRKAHAAIIEWNANYTKKEKEFANLLHSICESLTLDGDTDGILSDFKKSCDAMRNAINSCLEAEKEYHNAAQALREAIQEEAEKLRSERAREARRQLLHDEAERKAAEDRLKKEQEEAEKLRSERAREARRQLLHNEAERKAAEDRLKKEQEEAEKELLNAEMLRSEMIVLYFSIFCNISVSFIFDFYSLFAVLAALLYFIVLYRMKFNWFTFVIRVVCLFFATPVLGFAFTCLIFWISSIITTIFGGLLTAPEQWSAQFLLYIIVGVIFGLPTYFYFFHNRWRIQNMPAAIRKHKCCFRV